MSAYYQVPLKFKNDSLNIRITFLQQGSQDNKSMAGFIAEDTNLAQD